MNTAQKVIQKFGGVSPLAKALNKPRSSVRNWWDRGIIPAREQNNVLCAAQKEGVDLTPDDFFELELNKTLTRSPSLVNKN